MSSLAPASDQTALLAAYDTQLREEAEMASADSVSRAGPLWRGKFGDRGFVSYRSLGGLSGGALDDLIADTIAHYANDPQITSFEWKTRGHDAPTDLPQRLSAHGLQAEDAETVMLGETHLLAQPVPLPDGVTLRRIDNQPEPYADVVRAAHAQELAFGQPFGVDEFMRRIREGEDRMELWVAETPQEIVCVGRLELVPNSEFAGLWGGGTLPQWRGQGLYRALTSARAQSARQRGVRYLHSDCTEYSRPILERSGLLAVTTTTPYIWRR
ncbi:GNAT family N-acetyltransferase [Deinococcus arenicola]|uniref:GNAT family N-acetyltransferase n=1 Tax=Deinococcus arenicola TaxID=2994950 RepID=A0ABU4DQF5_9DEIO|nr:GNAT family N-acetyltransferase [Deinococcus sp. ZS9-10]MDV6374671.1 GNAT family N-acetyltransferase [Deinococcus sp. ZS9-10]